MCFLDWLLIPDWIIGQEGIRPVIHPACWQKTQNIRIWEAGLEVGSNVVGRAKKKSVELVV